MGRFFALLVGVAYNFIILAAIMGKGSARRPEDKSKIDANWDKIFKPKPKHQTDESKQSAKNDTIKR